MPRRCSAAARLPAGQMDIHPASPLAPARDFVDRHGGFFPERRRPAPDRAVRAHDLVRRDMLVLLCRSVIERHIPGDFAELGVYQGLTARLFHHYAPDRRLHLFDTFEGFDARDVRAERATTGLAATTHMFGDTDPDAVRRYIAPQNDQVVFHVGFFPDSVPDELRARRFALVHLDADLYGPTLAGLEFFYPRVEPGGFLVIHDYNAWAGARQAVETFMDGRPEVIVPMPDKSGSALIVRQ
ncbi:MAG: TylF/MycF/NovP-related O-methyltransferase [Vicinamibacterales bacterium]